ncbi:hypothetical protein RR49_01143 [Microbacterium ginsengisoli]|uniref:Uncharacterized protein n=1 Tax=Microbacterium ginsengisoli TaxID=400772 RepID=A0A0F0M058_9MICO|nr:hypothetical protein RR49_01143 [Microbacterium ginsengisoli]
MSDPHSRLPDMLSTPEHEPLTPEQEARREAALDLAALALLDARDEIIAQMWAEGN